jgi:hypothetical protein
MFKQNEKGFAAVLILVLIVVVIGGAGYFFYMNKAEQPPVLPVTNKVPLTLNLESPSDGTLITDSQVLIKGRTLAGATVVFYTDADENSVEADVSGNFEGTIGVVEGINTITVTAYGEDGQEVSTTLDIVNDTEE